MTDTIKVPIRVLMNTIAAGPTMPVSRSIWSVNFAS